MLEDGRSELSLDGRNGHRRVGRSIGALGFFFIFVLIVLSVIVWFLGSANPVTPAGYVGYLTQGSFMGSTKFVGLQTGPTSPGRTWLMEVENVSVTPYTYSEDFSGDTAVLSRDKLKISFSLSLIFKIRPEGVQQFIEKFSTGDESDPDKLVRDAYENFLQQQVRSYARAEVPKYDAFDINEKIDMIGAAIQARVQQLTAATPFEVSNIVVGNVEYPSEVSDAVSKKMAIQQMLQQKQTEIQIEQAEQTKRVIDAEGIAKSMDIINQRLTTSYLQYEAIEAQKQVIGSPDHTVIYIPVGALGVPIVNMPPQTTSQSAAQAHPGD
jgi:regulator of protease activity HflC (stomatin/prohibitin superfamily)